MFECDTSCVDLTYFTMGEVPEPQPRDLSNFGIAAFPAF